MKKMICTSAIVFMVICAKAQTAVPKLHGVWDFVSTSEREIGKIPQEQTPQLRFDVSRKLVAGFTGCNTVNGTFRYEGQLMALDNMVSTQKACENMELDLYVNPFLTQIGSFRIVDDKLYLYHRGDRSKYLIFQRVTATPI